MLISVVLIKKHSYRGSKEIYRLVSFLPDISKLFEKLIGKQVTAFMNPALLKFQCGFTKGFSTQDCLLTMLEKWKSFVDNRIVFWRLIY